MAEKKHIKYYIYDEIVIHNTSDDLWVVIHQNVINLTRLIEDRQNSWNDNLEYLITFGGKDLSHYFHKTGEPKINVSGITGKKRFLFGPAIEKATNESNRTPGHFWSTDPMYRIGRLTKQERRIRIINTLTGNCHHMTVCEEDTILDIQKKYKKYYNRHAESYMWRKDYHNGSSSGRLSLNRTLTENGIFQEIRGIGPAPALWLFFNDDLTIA